MSALPEAIASRLRGESIGSVLHIGAGRTIDPLYAKLGASRVVLIEGDERSVNVLRAQTAAATGVEVVCAVAAAENGTSVWHRCSLPSLSGLVDPARWEAFYPRIASISRQDVSTSSITALLDLHATDERCLLVLDVPGLEETLLTGLPAVVLERFEWIVVRHAGPAWRASSRTSIIELLEGGDHEAVASDTESEPLWPTTLLRLDRIRWGARLRAEANFAKEGASITSEERDGLRATTEAQKSRIDALSAEVEKLRAERRQLLEEIARESDASANLRSQLAAAEERFGVMSFASGASTRALSEAIVRAWHAQREAERHAYGPDRDACPPYLDEDKEGGASGMAAGEAAASRLREMTAQLGEARRMLARHDAVDQESASRQRRHEDEMVKVCAQVELIKDLLLRGEDL